MGILFLVLAGAVVYFLIMQSKGRNPFQWPPSGESALDILKKRYANGEITREEFDAMKRDLQ